MGTSAIFGIVTYGTAAPIHGVQATIVNEETGVAHETVTNRAAALVHGTYRVEIRSVGFEPRVRRGVRPEVDQTPGVDTASG